MIRVHFKPGVTLGWDEFLTQHTEKRAIALDGFISAPPKWECWEENGKQTRIIRNFNHHEGVDRTCTSSTCEQVRRAIMLRMLDRFRDEEGNIDIDVFANDADEDICLSIWLLNHPYRANEPLVRMLTQIEDLLDMSGGLFPMPQDSPTLGKVRWVFSPCFALKTMGTVTSGDLRTVMDSVHARIDAFAIGTAQESAPNGGYKILYNGDRWVLSKSLGPLSRYSLVSREHYAGVEVIPLSDSRFRYTVWKYSEYIDFPVEKIISRMNKIEPGWGGSNTIGGSPRGVGSSMSPKELFDFIENNILIEEVELAINGNSGACI